AAFRMALTWQPKHLPSLIALAGLLRATAPAEASVYYRHAGALDPHNAEVREGLALSLLATGDPSALSQLALLVGDGAFSFVAWDELARTLAAAPVSAGKSELLRVIAVRGEFPSSSQRTTSSCTCATLRLLTRATSSRRRFFLSAMLPLRASAACPFSAFLWQRSASHPDWRRRAWLPKATMTH